MARDVINPCKHQNDRETQHNGDYHKSLGPVGYFKRRKYLRHDLNQQPRHDCVRNCDAVNFSSLQFRKKVFQVHGSIRLGSKPPICFSVGNGNFDVYSTGRSMASLAMASEASTGHTPVATTDFLRRVLRD